MDENGILQFAGATGMNMEMFVCRSGERNKSLQCRFPVMLFKEIRLLLMSLFINHFRRTLMTVKIQAVATKFASGRLVEATGRKFCCDRTLWSCLREGFPAARQMVSLAFVCSA